MGLFSRNEKKKATGPMPWPEVTLPEPCIIASDGEAGKVLDEMGSIQRAIMDGGSVNGAGNELVSRAEGVVIYLLASGKNQAEVFAKLVAPLSNWSMGRLFKFDPDDPEFEVGRYACAQATDFRKKYQYLDPTNLD
ncbi:hypothetical protein [Leekyejoonella antrihumi]|uniref:Uncharacterized protein n=1 Tax=Leekyejoonella antrihumi TaxID=1660198 RepID=A0A563DRV3_9MICO|nr:hypothetical protein [Leekyejoonella antrihumi]TWP32998.1 hypothetical protein FGL98_22650 [Leekyejoonella antrihumi]